MRILITGGCGYVGHQLVPALLRDGHYVRVLDALYFGNRLPPHPELEVIKADIRHLPSVEAAVAGVDSVIHMACISNDPSFELDESLSRTINYECFEPLVLVAKKAGVRRFIYCSTSSVYGVSDAPDVYEDHPLVPLTQYNTYKAACEPLLLRHMADDFTCVILRPSTVCGYSPRQRLDLAANIMVNLAYNKGVITVHGGKQRRPNLHIQDMVRCYRLMLKAPEEKVQGETFNVGARNLTIEELAQLAVAVVLEEVGREVSIEYQPIEDERSYQVNSDKIWDVLRFSPVFTIMQAMRELCAAFDFGWIPNPLEDSNYYNVRRMREVWEDVYRDAPPSKFDPLHGDLSEIDLMRKKGLVGRDTTQGGAGS